RNSVGTRRGNAPGNKNGVVCSRFRGLASRATILACPATAQCVGFWSIALRRMSMRTMLMITALCLSVVMAPAQEPVLAQQVGRYQITGNGRDTFLFDSATGNVWSLTQFSDFNRDPSAWVPMFRLNSVSDTSPLLSEYGLKPRR